LASGFGDHVQVIDRDMARAAFSADPPRDPYNMSVEESRTAGSRMDCDFLMLVRSDVMRRSSSSRSEYYEAFAAIYVVSMRSGRLINWRLPTFESVKPETAHRLLEDSI